MVTGRLQLNASNLGSSPTSHCSKTPSTCPVGSEEPANKKKRILPTFITQGFRRETIASELQTLGVARNIKEARLAARGIFHALNIDANKTS